MKTLSSIIKRNKLIRFLVLLSFMLVIVLGSSFINVASAAAQDCTVDQQGADDEAGQRDVNELCLGPGEDGYAMTVTFNFDDTDWPGANTGDGCILFDTDYDGYANFTLCVTVEGGPPAVQSDDSPRFFSCDDDRVDRCTNGVRDYTFSSVCYVNVGGSKPSGEDADPFTWGHIGNNFCSGTGCESEDTFVKCLIAIEDISPGEDCVNNICINRGISCNSIMDCVPISDSCAIVSQVPNSDPSDCIQTPTGNTTSTTSSVTTTTTAPPTTTTSEPTTTIEPTTTTSEPAAWHEMEIGTTSTLNSIWGSSATDIFAVGFNGVILHYDGSAWSPMSSGTPTTLYGVWGSSGADVFAVGGNGVILHYDGSSWSPMNSGITFTLRAVWGSSRSDVFAVGFNGVILHYDGSVWSPMSSGTPTTLYGVWGSSGADVFAVGGDYITNPSIILHYDGSTWSSMESDATNMLRGVWGSSGSDVFAVGENDTLLHYNGNGWSLMESGTPMNWSYFAVGGSSGSNVFAWGQARSHYTGVAWSVPSVEHEFYCFGLWGSSSNDLFAVGHNWKENNRGAIYYYSTDTDNDGLGNGEDNCPVVYNPDQNDSDNDERGDACDNCLAAANSDQSDFDNDGIGDACEDSDGDTINDDSDNCPSVGNLEQGDSDGDRFGDPCDQGDRYAVLDEAANRVSIFDVEGNLLYVTEFGSIGAPYFIRDAGSSGWLLKGLSGSEWRIWHMDAGGALRSTFSGPSIGPGPFYSGLRNGSFVVINSNTSEITLYNSSGIPLRSKNVWNEPAGWSYSYLLTGDVAGLLEGGLVVLPELGSTFFGGAGFSPYLYFYDDNLNLVSKVDIISHNITLFAVVGLSDGGFVGIGNTDGGNYDTHLFYFNSSGNLLNQRDITVDIPSLAIKDFMNFTISSTNDGGVIVTELNGSKIWIYHSPPVQLDLSGAGVSSIGGIGGSYFQLEPGNDCEGNFDCDADTDGTDAATFKTDFGRSIIVHPCIAGDTCNGDFTCDGDVDGTDASQFKQDFGRSLMRNPCPARVSGPWCSY